MAIDVLEALLGGVHLFHNNDPWHFRNLARASITLFRLSMMEDWRPVVDIAMHGCGVGWCRLNR